LLFSGVFAKRARNLPLQIEMKVLGMNLEVDRSPTMPRGPREAENKDVL